MAIVSTPDHVAVAVPDIDASLARWCDATGGVLQWRFDNPGVFRGAVVQYVGGAMLELLMPSDAPRVRSTGGPSDFLTTFLERFGAAVHHVTLKVPDLLAAVAEAADHGLDAVDVDTSDPHWQEAFLRPSQIGGIIVQLASTDRDTAQEAAAEGSTMQQLPDVGPSLLGPRVGVTDLDRAAAVWTALGGTVTADGTTTSVAWPGEPLTVELVRADRAGPVGLRFSGTTPRPPDATLGAAVLATP